MEKYSLHYYGTLDSIEESCYSFQEYKVNGYELFIQCSGRFGNVSANLKIDNPALFVKDGLKLYRYAIEGITIMTDDAGKLIIAESILIDLCKKLSKLIK